MTETVVIGALLWSGVGCLTFVTYRRLRALYRAHRGRDAAGRLLAEAFKARAEAHQREQGLATESDAAAWGFEPEWMQGEREELSRRWRGERPGLAHENEGE